MIKKMSYILITTLCISLAACSYDLKHITLNEASDTGWTEVKKDTSGSTEIINADSASTNPKAMSNKHNLSESAIKLRELKKLKDDGLLTVEEYEKKESDC